MTLLLDQVEISYLLVALTGAVLLWRRLRAHLEAKKPFAELPMPPDSHFLLGHMPLLGIPFEEYFRILVKNSNENGQVGYWIAGTGCIAVTDWEDARKVFFNETYRTNIPLLTRHLNHFLGRYNVLSLMGREWKVQRTAISKAFVPAHHVEYQKIMAQVTHTLVTSLREKLQGMPNHSFEMDIEVLMKMATVDVFGLAALGTDFGCCKALKSNIFATSFDYLSSEATRRIQAPLDPFCFFYGLPTERNIKHRKAFDMIRSFCVGKIQERRQQQATASKSEDLLSRLIRGQVDASGKDVSNEVLTDVVMSLQFAGYDTTSLALVYALYCVDTHPQVEENCLREIESLDALTTNPADLVYCTAVVMETVRLYPPAFITSRHLQKPLQLSGGLVAPKGATVVLPIWAIHRQAKTWPQPESFRPDRWVKRSGDCWVERTEEDSSGDIAAANRKAFFGFGGGGRKCPGQTFAVQEAALVLAGLLKEFKFRVQPGYKLTPTRNGFVQSPKGMPMTIELRTKGSS